MEDFITGILPNMIPMRDIKMIEEGDRLFYELGKSIKRYFPAYGDNWLRTGSFKEIFDVSKMIKEDPRFSDIYFLNHHNFMLIKK